MPSASRKQHNLMAAVAHSPSFSKKVGIPMSVGKEFMEADKGKKFRAGGASSAKMQGINLPKTHHGKSALFAKGGEMKESKAMVKKEVGFMKKAGAPKSMVKHEEAEMAAMKKGGKTKKYAAGGSIREARMEPAKMEKIKQGNKKFGEHVIQAKGHTRGKNLGDSGKTVGIQGGARGMKRGGKTC